MNAPTPRRRLRPRSLAVVVAAALLSAPAANARLDATVGARLPDEPTVAVVEAGDGFDWADAGIGAGAAAGLVLLSVAASRIVRRHPDVAAIRSGRA